MLLRERRSREDDERVLGADLLERVVEDELQACSSVRYSIEEDEVEGEEEGEN